jgi:hypothetical protein
VSATLSALPANQSRRPHHPISPPTRDSRQNSTPWTLPVWFNNSADVNWPIRLFKWTRQLRNTQLQQSQRVRRLHQHNRRLPEQLSRRQLLQQRRPSFFLCDLDTSLGALLAAYRRSHPQTSRQRSVAANINTETETACLSVHSAASVGKPRQRPSVTSPEGLLLATADSLRKRSVTLLFKLSITSSPDY